MNLKKKGNSYTFYFISKENLGFLVLRPYTHVRTYLHQNVLTTLCQDKLHETFHSVTYPATAKT